MTGNALTIAAATSSALGVVQPSTGLQINAGLLTLKVPVFLAYSTVVTTLQGSSGPNLVTFNTAYIDTSSCFNTSTSQYKPNVAGYYEFSANVMLTNANYNQTLVTHIQKNANTGYYVGTTGAGLMNSAIGWITSSSSSCTTLIYMNGSSDYVSVYAMSTSAGIVTNIGDGTSFSTRFQGKLISL